MLLEKIEVLQAQVASLSIASPTPAPGVAAIPASEPPSGIPLQTPKIPALADGLRGTASGVPMGFPKIAAIVGPPPKVRGTPLRPRETPLPTGMAEDEPRDPLESQQMDPMVKAVLQQGSALSALVAHLASDAVGDLNQWSSSSTTSSTKGVQKRERMMAALADGSSQYFLQLQQQLHRRMMPSLPVPQSETELQAAQLSMLVYMERFGGYRNQRSLGMTMWLLSHCVDAAARGDFHSCREHLALTIAAIEQVSVDQGDWSLGFLQSLVAEPPLTVFQDRQHHLATYSSNFGPLTPSSWSATSLAFLKEMEILSTRKTETQRKPKAEPKEDSDPSPKRKARFPKKPKGKDSTE